MNVILSIILKITIIWIISFLILKLLEIKYGQRFVNILHSRSIHIQLFTITWYTSHINNLLKRFAQRFDRFWEIWFRVGNVVVIALLPITLVSLVYNLYILLSQKSTENVVITPILPGINFPSHHLIYLIGAFVVSAIFHEFGHAMSCIQLKNRINNIGLYFFFVIPGAYVDVNIEDLYRTPFWNQLKIYTAGVWHNLILALVISFIVLPSLPYIVSPLYRYSNTELYVTNVPLSSPLSNKIFPGDHIISINDCTINNQQDYIDCIYKVIDTKEQYCLRSDIHSCINETLNIRECLKNDKINSIKKCTISCDLPKYDCTEIYQYNYYIFKIKVQSIGYNLPEELTFLGTPEELWNSFSTNNYISRFDSLRSKDIPFILYTILNFVSAISLGLGAMNVLPIRMMDGQHIIDALVMTYLRTLSLDREEEDRIFEKSTRIIAIVTSVLLLINIIIATYYIIVGY